uniref:F-box domain-containing protein n=1 Tax=Araucaria cunninghamii TaxID=56994 RepID=A0A0D6QY73_ARACU
MMTGAEEGGDPARAAAKLDGERGSGAKGERGVEDEEERRGNQGLIPGILDDLALSCLQRLALPDQAVARAVSRSWRAAISNPEYLHSRRAQGLAEPWLFVLAFHKVNGRIQWQALDPRAVGERRRPAYHVIPEMPCAERVCPPAFGCASLATSGVLLVCGGMRSDIDCPMDSVLKYETYSNRWSAAGHMGTPRSFFASATIDGRVYAAGGSAADLSELSSTEAYDPAEDRWRPVASMGANMARYDAAVLDGKLHVTEGWSWPFHFSPRGQIYDPRSNRWEDMSCGMREGWTGLSVVLGNSLFIISEHGNSRLKFYDRKSDSWKPVDGPPMPPQLHRPFAVNTIDGKLYVVARSLHVAVGTVERGVDGKGAEVVSVQWEVITAPEAFADFQPSHSQVLYA